MPQPVHKSNKAGAFCEQATRVQHMLMAGGRSHVSDLVNLPLRHHQANSVQDGR